MILRFLGILTYFATFAFGTAAFGAEAADAFPEIPKSIQPFVDKGEIAGAVMLVANKDQVLHLSAVGQSNLAISRRMKTDDLFWIASMTKPITAVAIALLVDDRKLEFDDPVEKYIPEFRDLWVLEEQTPERRVLVKAKRSITLRDLLTHTSGLGEYRVTGPHWTPGEMSTALSREPLQFQPGTQWSYSTAGTDVLGHVVEVVSGMSFADFLDQRLFRPLEMRDTTFWPNSLQEKRLAHDYAPAARTGRLLEIEIPYLYGGAETDHARPPLGGAGLFSTAEDVAKFYQMMLNGGGTANKRQILRPETVAELLRKQTGDFKTRPGMPWGLGFCLVEDPSQMEANKTLSPGSFGHGGAHGTNSWADPKRGLIYVFMIQRDQLKPNPDDSPMRRAFQTAAEIAIASEKK